MTDTDDAPADVMDAIRAGRYENKVPSGIDKAPVDENTMTVRQAREHVERERQRDRDQRDAHRTEEARLDKMFRTDLERQHGLTGHPKADKVFNLAYERGHSGGREQVANEYSELAELLT